MLYASDAWCYAGFTDSDMKPFLAPSLRRPLSPFFMLFSPFLSAVAISGRWFFIIACRHLLTNVFLCLTLYLLFCYCSSQNTNMINTVFKMLTIMFFSGLSCALRTWSTCWTRRQPTSMRCWRSPSSSILSPLYLHHHHHCHHHQPYIISSHHHNHFHDHQVNVSGDQQHTDRERGHRHQKHEKALHVIRQRVSEKEDL